MALPNRGGVPPRNNVGDMKSGFVLVEIGLIVQTSYLCFWDWIGFVHYGLIMYIVKRLSRQFAKPPSKSAVEVSILDISEYDELFGSF